MADQFIPEGLSESIPANNQKIVEIYNKQRSNQIIVNKSYQRKLVWKNAHKFNFIDTILRNYPFPEIYLAPGSLDQVEILLIDEIVDGQQRLATIRDYIEGTDVFALPKIPIQRFSELEVQQRSKFLNYEVSVRYLKNVTKEQIKEIFQRINRTDYALNAAERTNAQWGESEFVCFSKQIIDPGFNLEDTIFVINAESRKILTDFFHGKGDDDDPIFSENDMSRMLAYQYIMTLVATLNEGEYFHRNEKLKQYIESYNDGFPDAAELLVRMLKTIGFIESLGLGRWSRWYKKANLFTLIIELDKTNVDDIDKKKFIENLIHFDHRALLAELGSEDAAKLTSDEEKYLGFAREAVNQKNARIFRGEFMEKIIKTSMRD